MSFIYEIIEALCFPNEKTKQIFEEYKKEKSFVNHVLTDTDSACFPSCLSASLNVMS